MTRHHREAIEQLDAIAELTRHGGVAHHIEQLRAILAAWRRDSAEVGHDRDYCRDLMARHGFGGAALAQELEGSE